MATDKKRLKIAYEKKESACFIHNNYYLEQLPLRKITEISLKKLKEAR